MAKCRPPPTRERRIAKNMFARVMHAVPRLISALLQLSDGFNGADLRNVVTEAGMFAIRDDRYVGSSFCTLRMLMGLASREYVIQEDLTKAARKVGEAKKHESKCLFRSPLQWYVDIRALQRSSSIQHSRIRFWASFCITLNAVP